MPICPGCEQTVPYDRLDVHQRYCAGIWSDGMRGGRSVERLDRRLANVEARLERRLREFEEDVERRLAVVDSSGGPVQEARRRE